jgi:hypothetical protein
MNWQGRPLTSVEVIVSLIAATTTTTGLKIKAEQSSSEYVSRVMRSSQGFARASGRRAYSTQLHCSLI